MTTASTALIRAGLTAILTGLMTDGGRTLADVYPNAPDLDQLKGKVAAWVESPGWETDRPVAGGAAAAVVRLKWRYEVNVSIWCRLDTAGDFETTADYEDDYRKAVALQLARYITANVPESSGVTIRGLTLEPGTAEWITTKGGRLIRLLTFPVVVPEWTTTTLTGY